MRDELVDVMATDKLLAETANPARENAESAQGENKNPTFIQAKTKREWHEAQLAELKHKKLLGSRLDAEDVKREHFAIVRTIRDTFLAIPDRARGSYAGPGREKRPTRKGITLRRDQIGPLIIALRKALHGTD